MRKRWLLVLGMAVAVGAGSAFAGQTRVGGHVRLTGLDYVDGDHNGVSGHYNAGFAFSDMLLYFSQELTEKISIDVQPEFMATSGATPVFHQNIGRQRIPAQNVHPEFKGWVKAAIKAALPKGYELSVGIVKPRFTWEYGAEQFWEDEINGGKFACSDYIGAMHDSGMELYKSFEVGPVSLPAYFYLLNGGTGTTQYGDNNQSSMYLVHVEPEIGPFKFQASAGTGKWDDRDQNNVNRWSAGIDYTWKKFEARAEYAGGMWQNSVPGLVSSDAHPMGYYAKIFYRFTPWCRAMLHYDYVDNDYTGYFYTAPGREKYVTWTPGVQLATSDSSAIQVQYDLADWRQYDTNDQETDRLKFNRLTVGWRLTF